MIISCGGALLHAIPQNNNSRDAIGLRIQSSKYNREKSSFVVAESFFIDGYKKSKKTEILKGGFTWDIISGLCSPYLLLRDTHKTGQVYRVIKVNSFDSTPTYEELYKFGKPITDDMQDYWIFGGPTFVIATHARSKHHSKVLLSLSVISMTDYTWTVTDITIPDLRRFPTCVGCVEVCGGEIVGIIRAKPVAKNGKYPKWEFCSVNLHGSSAAPPSPDLLADDDEEMNDLVDSSPGVKLIENILPQELSQHSIACINFQESTQNADEYDILIGIQMKTGGKVVECSGGKNMTWFDDMHHAPVHIATLQDYNNTYYLIHDMDNGVQVYDFNHTFISEYTNVERVLVDDFMNIGFDQVVFVPIDCQSTAGITLVEIGNLKKTKNNKTAKEENNIESVCRSLRMRAIQALDHLHDINNTIKDKNQLLSHAVNMLKSITSTPSSSTPTTKTKTTTTTTINSSSSSSFSSSSQLLPPFIHPGELVDLFEDQTNPEPIPSGEVRTSSGPPLIVRGLRHSLSPTGSDWIVDICICNTSNTPITCASIFLVTPDFPIASETSINNSDNSLIQPNTSSKFSLHSTLPPITSNTIVDIVCEWSSSESLYNIDYLSRVTLTPDLKSLESNHPFFINFSPTSISYSNKVEVTLYSARGLMERKKIKEILEGILKCTRTSKSDGRVEHYAIHHQGTLITIDTSSMMVVPVVIETQHSAKVSEILRVFSDNLPDHVAILPNYATLKAHSVVDEFVTSMLQEIDFILHHLSSHISNNTTTNNNSKSSSSLHSSTSKSNKTQTNTEIVTEYQTKQQIVDDKFYDLEQHFSYLCTNR